MKFGKEFTAQMVQEWQEAYMDYTYLKSLLKDILHFKNRNKNQTRTPDTSEKVSQGHFKRRVSLYRAFSGLTKSRYGGSGSSPKKGEEEVILVSPFEEGRHHQHHHHLDQHHQYQTVFLNAAEEGGEYEMVFFKRLDDEFNKVIRFYRTKVGEVMADAEGLSKQMDALIALRIKVENPTDSSVSASVAHPISDSSNPVVECVSDCEGGSPMELIQEFEMSSSSEGNSVKRGSEDGDSGSQWGVNGGNVEWKGFIPASLEVLDHVKINVERETPLTTMKNIISNSKRSLSYSKEELRKAEELMSKAFMEFYLKLRLLKSYCFLNQLAFSKIMKKYDKITLRNTSKTYLNMVDNSYLGSSDEVTKLMERVEATFIKHFANGNHRKGMEILRPKAKREKHRTTFLLGLFFGCSMAHLIALVLVIHARDVLNSSGGPQYMENIFPLYSFFGFIILHMLLYAANIYFWKRYRVNYVFIFGFKQGTELGYREVLLLSSAFAVLILGGVLSNLEMEMDPRTKSFEGITELVPLGLLTLVILITFCPFNIIYRSSRFFLITCAFHCICAPLYKVSLPDFFLADQLTSQVQAFRNLEFYVCYYGWGDFKRRSNSCKASKIFESFYFIIAMIPYWLRFLQCLRRLFEERDSMQGYNALKYLSTIIAVSLRTSYDLKGGSSWKILAAATSGFATVFGTYWDIVVDWGLLQRNSKNPWLRDKLVIPYKRVYYIAMVVNVVLRLAWMQTVFGFTNAPGLHRTALVAIVACLEIIRRGIWNFFRLENEHLNNVGKYRAFKSVPLPFYYEDDDDKNA